MYCGLLAAWHTSDHDVPLIIEEVNTALGRAGHLFVFECTGMVPDVLFLSKAVGGGYPLSVVMSDMQFDV